MKVKGQKTFYKNDIHRSLCNSRIKPLTTTKIKNLKITKKKEQQIECVMNEKK